MVKLLGALRCAMRAVRVHEFGGPEVLRIEKNVPVPSISDKQVLIRVKSVGVNPVETYIRQGTHSIKPVLPYTPGNDAAGIVELVGSSVSTFKKDDRVFCSRQSVSGCYAEFCVAEEGSCWALPSHISFSQGAAIGTSYFTAYRAIFHK